MYTMRGVGGGGGNFWWKFGYIRSISKEIIYILFFGLYKVMEDQHVTLLLLPP